MEADPRRPGSLEADPAHAAETRQLTRRLVLAVLVGVLLGGCLLTFAVRFVRVDGSSMAPALRDGDVVVVLLRPVAARRIEPGDVVLARLGSADGPGSQQVIKRVERRLQGVESAFFVLRGDRRETSRDSRQFGPIPASHVLGRAWLVLPRGEPWRVEGVADQAPASPSDDTSATGSGPAPAGR